MRVVPEKYLLHAHHWLILHGRYTCLARRPLCEKCIIADLCKWPGKTVNVPAAKARLPRSPAIRSFAIRCSAARSSLLVEASGSSSTNQTKRGC